jgi:competence protein ComEA helix-hairpin-helix repeat region
MDEKKQIKILLSAVLLGAAFLISYTVIFASPVRIYNAEAAESGFEISDTADESKSDSSVGMEVSDNSVSEIFEKVNINTASFHELIILPGVGEKTADAIIEYREEYGAFMSVEELMEVSGIGEKKVEALRDMVTAD